ncbi:unnamed protein product [Closterium sp. NIES-65]|nr:unnamed protein product [Closterium sp. NIES-65]
MSLNLFPPLTAEFLVAGGVPFGGYPQQHPYPMYPLQGYPMSPFGYPQQFQEGAGYGFPQGVFPPYGPQGFPAQPGMFVPPVGTATPGAMYPGYPPAAFGPTQAAQAAGGFPGGPSMMPSATQPAGVAGVAGVGAAAQPFGFQQMQGGQPQGFQGTGEQQQMGGASQLAGGPGAQTSQGAQEGTGAMPSQQQYGVPMQGGSGRRQEKPSAGRRQENSSPSAGRRQEKASGGRSAHADSSRVHAQAAAAVERILRANETRRGGCAVKGLTLAEGNVAKRATHAVTCETLRYLPVIKDLIAATGLVNSNWMKAKPHLVYVLVYDLVVSGKGTLGSGAVQKGTLGSGAVQKVVLSHKAALRAALARVLVKQRAASVEELLGPSSDPPVAAYAACESRDCLLTVVKQGAASVEELLGPSNDPPVAAFTSSQSGACLVAGEAASSISGGTAWSLQSHTRFASACSFISPLPPPLYPRYARVNTLRTTSDSVLVHFQAGTPQENGGKEGGIDAGASSKSGDGESGASSSAESAGLRVEGEVSVQQDELIPDVLVFPPGTELHRHALVEKGDLILQLIPDVLVFPPGTELHRHALVVERGDLILQGRASCFPAFILAPRPGWHVLDACAAPGNKTSHLAALMANTGRLTACERDAKRAALLRKNLDKAGVTCAHVHEGDFLAIDPASPEFADVSSSHLLSSDPCVVQAILLNPSEETCSFLNGNPLRSNEGFETQQVVWSPLKPLRGDLLLSQWGLVVRPCVACVLLHPSLSPNSRAGGRGSKGGESGRRGGGRGGGRGEGRGEGRGGGRGGGRDGGRGGGRGGKEEGNGGIEGAEASSGRQGEDERVERLARFQEAALRHALSFPAAQRVTYSTCSVNERENEAVVAAVLPLKPLPSAERITYSTCSINERENEAVVAAVLPAALSCGFRLAPALPAWPRRGMLSYPFGHQVVRTDPATDGTDGFFVALFERHVAGVADVAGAADVAGVADVAGAADMASIADVAGAADEAANADRTTVMTGAEVADPEVRESRAAKRKRQRRAKAAMDEGNVKVARGTSEVGGNPTRGE